jgi:hypothetical protein
VDVNSTLPGRADRFAGQPEHLSAAGTARIVRAVRGCWLPAAVIAAVIGLAACSGSSSSPQVASLGQGNGGNSSGTSSGSGGGGGGSVTTGSGNPTQLLDEWAACIRKHGDPSQSDPTIDADKDIEISMTNVPKALEDEIHGSTGPCSNYLVAASLALNGGHPQPTDNPVQDEKWAQCMRATGFPNWPDSVDGETNFRGTGIDPNSPAAQNATKTCDERVGLPDYGNGNGPAGVVQVTDCNAPAGVQCPKPGSVPGTYSGSGGPIPVSGGGTGHG